MRVSKNQEIKEVQNELKKTKKQLSAEIKRETKKGHPILTCLIIIIVFVLVAGGWISSTVARTGLVEVPVFTSLFYEQPAPLREVVATVPIEETLSDQITETINDRIAAIGGTEIDRSFSFSFAEEALSATVLGLLSEDGFLENKDAQVVVEKSLGIEVFLPVADNPLQTAITAEMNPFIDQEGLVRVDLTKLKIGSLVLPQWLVNLVLSRPLDLITWEFNKNFSAYVDLEQVQVQDGVLIFMGEISVDILTL